jgi:hypothetical protein
MNISEKINLTQASELLGVSVKTISLLCSEGHIQRDKDGAVTVGGAVHGYVGSIKAYGSRAGAEYKQVKTEELKHRVAARDGKYRQQANEEAYKVCMEAWPMVVNFLTSLPAICSRDNSERKRIRNVIEAFQCKFIDFIKTELRHAK